MAATKIPRQTQTTEVYTAAEQDTGKVWVDGRPIYRKVLRGQVTVAVGTVNIAHGISGLTTAMELVNISQMLKLGQGSNTGGLQIIHRETGGNWAHFTAFDSTNVGLTSSFAWGNTYYCVILEYVK